MGMFDKDKEIGLALTREFANNEEFALYGVSVQENAVQTDFGWAAKTTLTVARLDTNARPGPQFQVTTLGGAIADKAREADADDFPCVVKWITVPSKAGQDATVLQWVRDAKRRPPTPTNPPAGAPGASESRPPAGARHDDDAGPDPAPARATDEDIPF
jgi:hypothetical protein